MGDGDLGSSATAYQGVNKIGMNMVVARTLTKLRTPNTLVNVYVDLVVFTRIAGTS